MPILWGPAMRLPRLLVFALVAASPAAGQEVKHWPLSQISFPVDLAQFNQLSPKPASIRFHARTENGKWEEVANRKPSELDEIVDTKDPAAAAKRGFTYTARTDGEVEFAVQYQYGDGTLTPAKLAPQYRIRFDTRPPGVKAVATGPSSIRWQVDDDNLVLASIRVEGRYAGTSQWEFLNTGELKAEDAFKWNIPPGKTLEVRVYARDRAGHENRSLPIKLAGGSGDLSKLDDKGKGGIAPPPPGSFGDPVKVPPGGKTGTGYGGVDELPNRQPKIEYVSTDKLRVTSKITHITRSGVEAAQLYVLEPGTSDWHAAGAPKKDLGITADTPDDKRFVSIDYAAPRNGLYGFILQPISGAGTKQDDPRTGDIPQYLVHVDTILPEMEFKRIGTGMNGLNGPLVEIEWEAKDAGSGFHPEPIMLEYSEDLQKWNPIVAKTTNTGRYTWEITNKKLWKFYVRGSATDMAGNTRLVTHDGDDKKPVLVKVDLDRPSGNVDKVNPNGPATPPPPGGRGINTDVPGAGGGGVTGVSGPPPDKLPGITPIGNPTPMKPAGPPPAVPTAKPGVTPMPPMPPVKGPDVPELPPLKKDDPKPPAPPKKDDKKPDDKKKTDIELLPEGGAPTVQPINLPPPPAAETPPATIPLPPITPVVPPPSEGK